jgi:magnesium and cobalt exporter, CNNM family
VTTFLELLAVAALILLNAFFVAAEYGLVTARRTRLREYEERGDRRARNALAITGQPPRFIAAMQLGVTLTSLGIGAVGETVLKDLFDPWMATILAIVFAFLIITFLHVVIGELVPKGVALRFSERVALAVSAPVRVFFLVFGPLIWILQRTTELILRAMGMEPPGAEGDVHSEAELRMLLDRSQRHGEIEEEQQMISKVFDFGDKDAADVMVPRLDVVALSIDLPPEEALKAVMDSPYTRYPVYRESLDEIVGILHVRDLFAALMDRGIEQVELDDLLRTPYFVPETKDLASLLAEFRAQNLHMAIVLDEYGAMDGIVTLEDLLEEIVGEIEDEFDLPHDSLERLDDHTARISGTFPIDEFNEQLGVALPEDDYHTVAGFVFGLIGRAPEAGDEVEHEGVHFHVDEVDGTRIQGLTVTLPSEGREAVGAEERAADGSL